MTDSTEHSYREVHRSPDASRYYVDSVYAPESWDSWVWALEQEQLADIWSRHGLESARHLDFACGTGRITRWAEQRTAETTGVDISADMLGEAKAAGVESTLVEADLTADPSAVAGPFDVITAFRFFLNAEPPLREAVLDTLHGLLGRGGLLVTNVHLSPTSLYAVTKAVSAVRRTPVQRTLSTGAFTDLVQRHGFAVEERHGLGLLNRSLYERAGDSRSERLESLTSSLPGLDRLAMTQLFVLRRVG